MNDWQVDGYYADDVKPPKRPGALALSVRCHGATARDLEVSVLEARADIGEVVVVKVPAGWHG